MRKIKIAISFAITLYLLITYSTATFAQQISSKSSMDEITTLLNEGDTTAAIKLLVEYLDTNPDNAAAYLLLAKVHYNAEDYHKVIDCCNNAVNNSDTTQIDFLCEVLILRGVAHKELEQYEKSLNDFDKVLSLCPKKAEALCERGKLRAKLEDYDKSDEDYRRALAINSEYSDAHFGLAFNKLIRKDFNGVLAYLKRAEACMEEKQAYYFLRGCAYLGLKKIPEALEDLFQLLKVGYDEDVMDIIVEIAKENHGLVESRIKKLISNDNKDSNSLMIAASFYEMTGHIDNAISLYKSALDVERNSIFAKKLADCYFEKRDMENAFRYMDEAINISPANASLYEYKAQLLCFVGNIKAAISTIDIAISKNGTAISHLFTRGVFYSFLGDYKHSLDDLSACLENAPMLTSALMYRAIMYWNFNQRELARRDCLEIIRLENESGACRWRCFAHLLLGEAELAEKTLDSYLEQEKRCPASLFEAACFYSLLGKPEISLEHLRAAVQSGYQNLGYLYYDPRLEAIKKTSGFQTIISPEYLATTEKHPIETSTESNQEPPHRICKTFKIPYTDTYGLVKIKGKLNNLPILIFYDASDSTEMEITNNQVTYLLKSGYIKESDITSDGQVTIHSLKLGDVEINDIVAKIVPDDHLTITIGKPLFKGAKISKTSNNLVVIYEITL